MTSPFDRLLCVIIAKDTKIPLAAQSYLVREITRMRDAKCVDCGHKQSEEWCDCGAYVCQSCYGMGLCRNDGCEAATCPECNIECSDEDCETDVMCAACLSKHECVHTEKKCECGEAPLGQHHDCSADLTKKLKKAQKKRAKISEK